MSFIELVKPYVSNSLWFFLEQVLKAIGSILIFGLIARHYGPYQFGVLNFAIAVVSVIVPLVKLGLESTLVVYLSSSQAKTVVIKAAFMMVTCAGFLISLFLNAILFIAEINDPARNVISLLSIGFIALGFHTLDPLYQSLIKTKLSSISKSLALLLGIGIKLYLLSIDASIELIAASFSLDYFIVAALLLCFLNKVNLRIRLIFFEHLDMQTVRSLFIKAWPMIISGVTGVLLLKTDQMFINYFLGPDNLGIYSAGSKIYEGWISFMYVYSIAALPLIIRSEKTSGLNKVRELSYIFAIPLWTCILFALVITIYGHSIIRILFGSAYIDSYYPLVFLAWSSLFASFGYMSSRYLIVGNLQKIIAQRNFIALFINIILNIILIKPLGLIGVGLATLITLILVHFVLDFFNRNLVELRIIKLRSFIFFLR